MAEKDLREPAVAGRFYPANEAALRREVDAYLAGDAGEKTKALGVVSPHAGYMYSGAVAGAVLSRVAIPARVAILGPNHRGVGKRGAVAAARSWRTPLGEAPVDGELAAALVGASPLLELDDRAHRDEHSLEVQAPFLQRLRPDVAITPVCLGRLDAGECAEVGRALAEAIEEAGGDVLILASSDMTHYEPREAAETRDRLAIDAMLSLDPDRLLEVVERERITMCGVIPAAVMLHAALRLGAEEAILADYKTSGDVSGDYGSVVGYAGIVVA